jgi:hypothetical protein
LVGFFDMYGTQAFSQIIELNLVSGRRGTESDPQGLGPNGPNRGQGRPSTAENQDVVEVEEDEDPTYIEHEQFIDRTEVRGEFAA